MVFKVKTSSEMIRVDWLKQSLSVPFCIPG